MDKKIIFLIIFVSLLAYGNSLGNGFIGDDHYLFENNHFYKDLKNLPKLLSNEAILTSSDLDPANLSKREASGTMSYRPVTLFTFFVDYFLWKENPFGFHLSNLIMHTLNCLLVFLLVYLITKKRNISVLSTLFFCTHPIHVDAVSNIGFRYDLVSMFFYLTAFIAFLKIDIAENKWQKNKFLFFSYSAFFLGVFAKESCSSFPIMIVVFDLMRYKGRRLKDLLLEKIPLYAGYFIILAFYWYIYLFVFKNTTHSEIFGFNKNYLVPAFAVLKIFHKYIIALLWPFNVTVTPSLYVPAISAVRIYEALTPLAFLVLCGALAKKYLRKSLSVPFFILWFFITFIPTSNIIPLINPIAFRYLYLPSLGYCVVLAVLLEDLSLSVRKKFKSIKFGLILKIATLALFISATVFLNRHHKDDFTYLTQIIKNYPDSAKAYWELGMFYFDKGEYEKALKNYNHSLNLEIRDPFHIQYKHFVHHQIGRCYVNNPDKAIEEFKKAIEIRPDYVACYADVANAYIQKNKHDEALKYALHAIELNDGFLISYSYAIYSYYVLGKRKEAAELIKKGLQIDPNDSNLNYWKKLIIKE